MTQAVIDACYSSDNQRDASIEDQVRQCRARIDQEGWQRGRSILTTPSAAPSTLPAGYQKKFEEARAGRFEVLFAEALSTNEVVPIKVPLIARAAVDGSGRDAAEATSRFRALLHRDGLVIALLAADPIRRANFTDLEIGKTIIKDGTTWSFDIPAEETKWVART